MQSRIHSGVTTFVSYGKCRGALGWWDGMVVTSEGRRQRRLGLGLVLYGPASRQPGLSTTHPIDDPASQNPASQQPCHSRCVSRGDNKVGVLFARGGMVRRLARDGFKAVHAPLPEEHCASAPLNQMLKLLARKTAWATRVALLCKREEAPIKQLWQLQKRRAEGRRLCVSDASWDAPPREVCWTNDAASHQHTFCDEFKRARSGVPAANCIASGNGAQR